MHQIIYCTRDEEHFFGGEMGIHPDWSAASGIRSQHEQVSSPTHLKISLSLPNRARRFVLGHAVAKFFLCDGGLLLLFLTDPGDADAHTSGLAGQLRVPFLLPQLRPFIYGCHLDRYVKIFQKA
jgi:hypothetical protein